MSTVQQQPHGSSLHPLVLHLVHEPKQLRSGTLPQSRCMFSEGPGRSTRRFSTIFGLTRARIMHGSSFLPAALHLVNATAIQPFGMIPKTGCTFLRVCRIRHEKGCKTSAITTAQVILGRAFHQEEPRRVSGICILLCGARMRSGCMSSPARRIPHM